MKQRIHLVCPGQALQGERGFALIELLMVLAVMAVLVGISIPAITGVRSSYDRNSAVTLVMSAIEQARVDALQSGENAYVVMARTTDSGTSPDALIVVGDPPLGSAATGVIPLTKWIKLPQNVRFLSSTGTLVVSSLPSSVTASMLPSVGGNPIYSGFTFNSTGSLQYPASGGLDIALYEGIRAGQTETAQGPTAAATDGLSDSGLYEVIRLDRFSGRSWMNVSSLAQK
jgi:type IV fimbrial biogenesis protein FimU